MWSHTVAFDFKLEASWVVDENDHFIYERYLGWLLLAHFKRIYIR